MKKLIFLAVICLLIIPSASWAKDEGKRPEDPKSVLIVGIERFVRGSTMRDSRAKNVSFHLGPTRVSLAVSF